MFSNMLMSNKVSAPSFMNETFTDVDHTLLENHISESGHVWTKQPGAAMEILTNQVTVVSGVQAFYTYDTGKKNQAVDITISAIGWGFSAYLFRFVDMTHMFGIQIEPSRFELIQQNGAGWITLRTWYKPNTDGMTITLIDDASDSITVKSGTYTFTAPNMHDFNTATKQGLWIYNNSTSYTKILAVS